MIAVDANILIYAHRRETRHHDSALKRLTELAEGDTIWAALRTVQMAENARLPQRSPKSLTISRQIAWIWLPPERPSCSMRISRPAMR